MTLSGTRPSWSRKLLASVTLLVCQPSRGLIGTLPRTDLRCVGIQRCQLQTHLFKGRSRPKSGGPGLTRSSRWSRLSLSGGNDLRGRGPQTSSPAAYPTLRCASSSDDRECEGSSEGGRGGGLEQRMAAGKGVEEEARDGAEESAARGARVSKGSLAVEGGGAVICEGISSPPWAPDWMPKWATNMPPMLQVAANMGLYMLHMLYLSKCGLAFPIQLIPNNHGLFQGVGLDTLAGFIVIAFTAQLRVRAKLPLLPRISAEGMPWKLNGLRVKSKLPITMLVLLVAYLLSGWGSQLCEYLLYRLSLMGIPMSIAMHRSVQVLMSHLLWVGMGIRILGLALRPFFDRKKGTWIKMRWKTNWLWWVIGGYYVSASLFNLADLANQFLCPLPPDTESVVVKIINPENNDVAAMAVGSIAPCVTAPWWEEVLYRGFLLPALTLYLPLALAVPTSAALFAAHHMNLQAMLPLSILGLVWSLLYMCSGNLLVTVFIHAMWNSRVFLGSLLGL
ncbi:unnamed protein product [Discosporangium mesarthrocarpum]